MRVADWFFSNTGLLIQWLAGIVLIFAFNDFMYHWTWCRTMGRIFHVETTYSGLHACHTALRGTDLPGYATGIPEVWAAHEILRAEGGGIGGEKK